MKLRALATACDAIVRGDDTLEASGISHVAQAVQPGWVFAALPGQHRHGIEFVAEARSRGAVAVLSDRDPGAELAWLRSDSPRRATAHAAWTLADHPENRLRIVGITGTNGKSTVADLLGGIARSAGIPAGVFGTLTYALPNRQERASRTTPEAPDLARLFAELVEQGGTTAIMEISSHALVLERVAGLPVDVAVWTNLTHDHLDFHGDLEAYFAAKRSLEDHLRADPPGRRVIGADDEIMARLLATARPGDLTFGLAPDRDVTAAGLELSEHGSRFDLVTPAGTAALELRLVGRHNVRNALAAAAAGIAAGWPLAAIVAGLSAAVPLAGRLEPVATGTPFPVFVDYAHTPDGLRQVLSSLREVSDGRLIVVFGCGGDRDHGKRAPMGETVGTLADVPIVTSDNPRSEDPLAIVEAVMVGVRRSGNTRALAIPDRREAIAAALAVADRASIVVIAGKGHETEQIFANQTIPFDDREVVRELARRRTA